VELGTDPLSNLVKVPEVAQSCKVPSFFFSKRMGAPPGN